MTSSTQSPSDDDAFWRRPAADQAGERDPGGHSEVPPAGYSGPPRTQPPPYGWRPPTVVQPPEPRQLPAQDHAALDIREQTAQTVTSGVGLVVGAIMIVLLLILCGRWLL